MNNSLPGSRSSSQDPQNLPLSHAVARNTFFNLVTQGILIIAAVWSLPFVINGLSNDGFGLLSLVWVFVGYFSLFDFGLSKAITKFIAEAAGRHDLNGVARIARTSLAGTLFLGCLSGAFVYLISPYLVYHVFTINDVLMPEALASFRLAGVGIPFMLLLGTLRGFQMALQRFDLSNLFQLLVGIPQWVGSVLLLRYGYGFIEVVWLTIGIRILIAIIGMATLPMFLRGVYRSLKMVDRTTMKKLWTFSSWVTVSQTISPLFMYIERLIITVFLPLAVVSYYSVPHEALTRVLVLAISFTAALFPALSSQASQSLIESQIGLLYRRSVKYLTLGLFPVVVSFIFLAPELLTIWLGAEFASHCVLISQIIATGLFFNSLSQIPMTVLHAIGRPDLTAKFHLLELPIAILLGVLLIPWLGAEGAAIAWSLRVILDAGLLFFSVRKVTGNAGARPVWKSLLEKYAILVGSLIALLVSVTFIPGTLAKILVVTCCLGIYSLATWIYAFDDRDRNFLSAVAPLLFRRP